MCGDFGLQVFTGFVRSVNPCGSLKNQKRNFRSKPLLSLTKPARKILRGGGGGGGGEINDQDGPNEISYTGCGRRTKWRTCWRVRLAE